MEDKAHKDVKEEADQALHRDAGQAVLKDLKLSVEGFAEEEQKEVERHNAAITAIAIRREKLLEAIAIIQELYSLSTKAGTQVDTPINNITNDSIDSGSPLAIEINPHISTFLELPGGMKKAIIDVVTLKDTFLTTEDVERELKHYYPSIPFTRKQITDGIKNTRKKEVIGLQVYRGNFPLYLHGLHSYYLDENHKILKPEYQYKLTQRLSDSAYSLNPVFSNEKI